jgi:hypothetical protein
VKALLSAPSKLSSVILEDAFLFRISVSSVRVVRGAGCAACFDGAGAIVTVGDFPKESGSVVVLRIMVEAVLRIIVEQYLE